MSIKTNLPKLTQLILKALIYFFFGNILKKIWNYNLNRNGIL